MKAIAEYRMYLTSKYGIVPKRVSIDHALNWYIKQLNLQTSEPRK